MASKSEHLLVLSSSTMVSPLLLHYPLLPSDRRLNVQEAYTSCAFYTLKECEYQSSFLGPSFLGSLYIIDIIVTTKSVRPPIANFAPSYAHSTFALALLRGREPPGHILRPVSTVPFAVQVVPETRRLRALTYYACPTCALAA